MFFCISAPLRFFPHDHFLGVKAPCDFIIFWESGYWMEGGAKAPRFACLRVGLALQSSCSSSFKTQRQSRKPIPSEILLDINATEFNQKSLEFWSQSSRKCQIKWKITLVYLGDSFTLEETAWRSSFFL